MQKLLFTLVSAAVLGLSGCAATNNPSASTPAEAKSVTSTASAKSALSPDAEAALTAAQADVKMAKAKNALWTTAEIALKAAETAAGTADNASVIKQSRLASEHAKLGLDQLNYPLTKVGD